MITSFSRLFNDLVPFPNCIHWNILIKSNNKKITLPFSPSKHPGLAASYRSNPSCWIALCTILAPQSLHCRSWWSCPNFWLTTTCGIWIKSIFLWRFCPTEFAFSCSFSISKAEVASSNIKMVGSFTAILAMAMRCFCPPEKLDPLKPTNLSKPFLILFYSYLKVYDDSGSSALTTVSFYILSFSISEFSLTLSSSLRMNLVALARSAALRISSSEASGRP